MMTGAPPLPSLSAARTLPTQTGTDHPVKIDVERLNFFYGAKRALEDISVKLKANVVSAFIGPSGCGKSTFLRTLNRMNDIIPETRVEGTVLIDGVDIYDPSLDVVGLRRRVGMVFQKSNPFPSRSSRTSPTVCASTGWPAVRASSPSAWRRA
jgi:ABC-type phosphate transport system ATPase subunit